MSYLGIGPIYGNPKLFTDVGDGVTDEYTLDWVPGSKNSLSVFVNGLFTTLFTVANNVITFDSPPANLATIVVVSSVPHTSMVIPADDTVTVSKLANDVLDRFTSIEADVTTNTNSINTLNTTVASRVKQYFYAGF